VYRDSQLGLCLDLSTPEGNFFNIWAHAENMDKQIGRPCVYKQDLDLTLAYLNQHGLYPTPYCIAVEVFKYRYPFVHILNEPEDCGEIKVR
jgi:hypothetical protein